MKNNVTIDQICKGLRILEKYSPNALVIGYGGSTYAIQLQEEAFWNKQTSLKI